MSNFKEKLCLNCPPEIKPFNIFSASFTTFEQGVDITQYDQRVFPQAIPANTEIIALFVDGHKFSLNASYTISGQDINWINEIPLDIGDRITILLKTPIVVTKV